MNKKKVLIATFTIVIMVALILIIGAIQNNDGNNSGNYMECDALMPMEVTMERFNTFSYGSECLDFSKKGKITSNKYGFVKTFVVDEEMLFVQSIDESHEMKHLVYGVYEDQQLEVPVVEVKLKNLFRTNMADDYGIVINSEDSVSELLEPGTYYLGIYTTKNSDDFMVEYYSLFGYRHMEYQLKEGEVLSYTTVVPHQINLFEIKPAKSGMISVDVQNHCSEIQLLDEDKNVINETYGTICEENGEYIKQPCLGEFYVEKGKNYSLKVVSSQNPDIDDLSSSWQPMSIMWTYK